MAEENIPSEGAIPPKQSPLTPSAAAPAPAAGGPVLRKPPVITRKPILRKPGETVSAPPVPVPPPPAAPAPAASVPAAAPGTAPQGITIPRDQAAKKMTARINLAAATGQIPSVTVPPATDDVKTIKLKPPTATQSVSPQDSAAVAAQAAKSKTSRISLESALSTQPELPPASPGVAPKTIRLKRPSEMNAPAAAKPVLKPPTTHVQVPQPPHQTGPIAAAPVAAPPPEAPQEAPDNSPTRKKTIKVKRPGAGGGGPKISLNKGEEGESGANGIGDDNLQSLSSIDSFGPAVAPDKVNPVFIVAAVIAILATINLVWVLTAQLFGPNAAVADYAKAQGPDVPNPPFALTVE